MDMLRAGTFFLGQWGAGFLCFLFMVPRSAGTGFFRLSGALAAALLILAALLRGTAGPEGALGLGAAAGAAILLGAAGRPGARAVILPPTAGLALAAVLLEGRGSPLTVLNAAASALLLGSVTAGLLLGHWYLVATKLPVEPLRRLSLAFAGSAGAKTLLGVWPLFLPGGPGAALREDFLAGGGVFYLPRALFGFLVPLLLSGMVHGTARIRSTQSATGILYAAVACTLMGELLGKYLYLTTGLPG